jgi:O-antigen/teichoic acid export membrane protein
LNDNQDSISGGLFSGGGPGGRLSRAGSWLLKGIWTIADQALFAGSNFVLSILLARWLNETDFGAYSIGLTIFWMASTIHTGFLTEPMLVFGPGRFRDNLSGYSGFIFRGHAALSLITAFLLLFTGVAFGVKGSYMLAQVFYALSISQFFVLLMWILRKACYVRLKPRVAAMGGAVYAAIMLPSAYFLYSHSMLSAWTAIGLLSIAALVSSLVIMFALRLNPLKSVNPELMFQSLGCHLSYGKWAAVTGIITWIPEQLPFIVTGAWHGLDQTAAAKALWNFAMPVAHACTAISVFLVPVFVRMRGRSVFFRTVAAITLLVATAAAGCSVLIGVYGSNLMVLFYKGKYADHSGGLWLIGAITVLSAILSILSACVRAIEKPQHVFWAYGAASAVSLSAGMFLMYRFGVTGALVSIAASLFTSAVFMTVFILKSVNKKNSNLSVGKGYASTGSAT